MKGRVSYWCYKYGPVAKFILKAENREPKYYATKLTNSSYILRDQPLIDQVDLCPTKTIFPAEWSEK